jgi:hypothetical protein
MIVTLDVPQAANLLGFGGAEAVDPLEAKAAIDAWNLAAHRQAAASQPRGPQLPSWVHGPLSTERRCATNVSSLGSASHVWPTFSAGDRYMPSAFLTIACSRLAVSPYFLIESGRCESGMPYATYNVCHLEAAAVVRKFDGDNSKPLISFY